MKLQFGVFALPKNLESLYIYTAGSLLFQQANRLKRMLTLLLSYIQDLKCCTLAFYFSCKWSSALIIIVTSENECYKTTSCPYIISDVGCCTSQLTILSEWFHLACCPVAIVVSSLNFEYLWYIFL